MSEEEKTRSENYQPYQTPRSGQNTGNNDLESYKPAEPFRPNGWPGTEGSDWANESTFEPDGRKKGQ